MRRLLGTGGGSLRAISILVAVAATSPCFAQDVKFNFKSVDEQVATRFKKQFLARKEMLEKHLVSTNFIPLFTGNIDVEVSSGQPFSEALLFAWEGRRGHMYFPVDRAKDGKAAILHELAHVHAPNQVRFLAEGYSAYLEEKMGNIKAFPTRGLHSECSIAALDERKSALRAVSLVRFDGLSTEKTETGAFLGDHMGLEEAFLPKSAFMDNQRRNYAYVVSASFVKFLIERHGEDKFKALYQQTPLTPHVATRADPVRYQQTFSGKLLTELQSDWLRWLTDKQKSCD